MNRILKWILFTASVCLTIYATIVLFFGPENEDPKTKKRNNEAFPKADFEEVDKGPGKPPVS